MNIDAALEYIKSLANGINPITNKTVENDSLLNNPEIIRGLFNSHHAICETLNSKGVKRNEFRLTEEQVAAFMYSEEPLKITEITERLNMLKDESLRTIQPVRITNWLLSQGILETDLFTYGKESRLPSEKGKQLGITIKQVARDNGEKYAVNLYNMNAQKFIINNLNSILEH